MRPLIVASLWDGILAAFRSMCSMAANNMQFEHTQDLTGQVTKTEPHYFAYGGNGDVWKGRWTQKYPVCVMEVQTCLLIGQPFMKR
jgi:hypothetical protein